MANTTFTKHNKTFLPDIKSDHKKASDPLPQNELMKNLGLGKTQKLGEKYLNVRGHIVPGCSQIHSKSSESSEVLSEKDITKKRNSKLRTMKVQPVTEKNLLMEKFESSLKERLLSSAHFSKQVPLFDSMVTKDKVRKTPSVDEDDLSKNESMFNAVFPARKDTGRCGSPWINDKLFSKHNRESQDWLKQIENESQKNDQIVVPPKDKLDIKKTSSSSKKIKRIQNKSKEENIIHTELNSGPLEQLKFLSSPRLSSRVGEKGSSRSKIAKEKYSSLKLNVGDSKKLILPKLASKNTSKEAKKSVILENQKTMESDALDKTKVNSSSLLDTSTLEGGKTNKIDNFQNAEDTSIQLRCKDFSKETLKDLSEKKLSLCTNSSSDFNNASADNMEITYTERDVSEIESVEIYGEHSVAGIIHRGPKPLNLLKGVSQSTSFEADKSSSFSNKSLRRGGPMGGEDSLMHYDEYNVLFFETVKDSLQKVEEEERTTEDITPTETTETLTVPLELPTQEFSNVTLAEDHSLEHSPVDELEEEELPKEVKEGEEDCTAEPCNEPQWFEEYGIDKKSRKDMVEEVKSEESLEGDYGEAAVTAEEDIIQEVVHDDEDVLEAKKKKVRKVRPTELKEQEEDLDVVEEVQEFESETVREIKTIPLVTIDLIPEKERPVIEEKPLSQMPSEYLKKYVGKHLVAGLAQVALHMPSDPVEYLAHWLIKERKKEDLLEEFKQFKREVKEIRKKNIDELRRKLQIDYLQDEALKRYHDGKYEPLYPTFDSSESELDMEEGGKAREEEITSAMTELDDQD